MKGKYMEIFSFRLYRNGPDSAQNTTYILQMIGIAETPLDITLIGVISQLTREQVTLLQSIVNPFKGAQKELIVLLNKQNITLTI
jgi:hypothetical protein